MSQFQQQSLCDFLNAGVTPFHVVQASIALLEQAGYAALPDNKAWQLKPNGKYYVCLLYTSPSPRDQRGSRMPSSA